MSMHALALGAMLVPTLAVGCGEDLIAPDPPTSEALRTHEAAFAPAPLGAQPDVCVPFTTSGSAGSVEISGGPPPAPLEITLSSEGHATHLGRYSGSASFVVMFPSPTAAVFDGGGSFTGANGDEVYFEFSGDFFPGPVNGGLGDYDIVGGTGRFEGATGSGAFIAEGGTTTFDGDICFAR